MKLPLAIIILLYIFKKVHLGYERFKQAHLCCFASGQNCLISLPSDSIFFTVYCLYTTVCEIAHGLSVLRLLTFIIIQLHNTNKSRMPNKSINVTTAQIEICSYITIRV